MKLNFLGLGLGLLISAQSLQAKVAPSSVPAIAMKALMQADLAESAANLINWKVGDYQDIQIEFVFGGGDGVVAALDLHRLRLQPQRVAALLEEAGRHQRQVLGALAGEELRQVHPVIGGARLLAQHRDFGILHTGLVEAFQKLVAHHAVADDDDLHAVSVMTDRKNPAVEGSVREAGSARGTSAGAPGNGERGKEREEGADDGAAIDERSGPVRAARARPAVVGRGWG